MKRRRIILMALAAVTLAVVAGIAAWRWLSRPAGLSAPIALVEIPAGEFLMGDPWNQHLVRITYAFKMGKYEVTQKQWREVMGTTIRQQRDKAQRQDGDMSSLGERLKELGKDIKYDPFGAFEEINNEGLWRTLKTLAVGEERWPLPGEGDDYPMYYVSWDEATEFCARLSRQERATGRRPAGMWYRLPTKTEWEYACRAGSTTRFANGNTEADLNRIGWYKGNSGGTTHPVGTKLPNAWGLHDTHGNVEEFCRDNDTSNRGRCGGGCSSSADYCGSAFRIYYYQAYMTSDLGFRVALVPPVPEEEEAP